MSGAAVHIPKQGPQSGEIVRDVWGHTPRHPSTPKSSRTFKIDVRKSIPRQEIKPPWFWTPARSRWLSPEAQKVRKRLKRLDAKLDISWHPTRRLWQIWVLSDAVKSDWCAGWKRLFMVHDWALDDRVFMKLYDMDASRFPGGGKTIFKMRENQRKADIEKVEAKHDQETRDIANMVFDHSRPSVGYGRSRGDKFATYDAGD